MSYSRVSARTRVRVGCAVRLLALGLQGFRKELSRVQRRDEAACNQVVIV